MAWTKIEEVTLSSSAASVTLGNGGTIPQTYKSLMLLTSVRTTDPSGGGCNIRPNGSGTTTGFSERLVYGSGTAAASANTSSQTSFVWILAVTSTKTANTFASAAVTFPNYSSTTANKPISADSVTENNAADADQYVDAGLWSNTNAITSLYLFPSGGSFATGSTFTLYGLN